MQLTIKNFIGIKEAQLRLHPKITLVCGRVGSGKTSIVRALQACLTGVPLPLPDVLKKDAKIIVHEGEKSGGAELVTETGRGEIQWPKCVATAADIPCSLYSVGMKLPALIPPAELSKVLGILPTEEDFFAEADGLLEAYGTTREQLEALWKKIQINGWDSEHARVRGIGQELKRNWEKLSGENWGTDIAMKFVPPDYVDESLEALEESLKTAEKLLEHSIKAEALNDNERANLESQAKQIADLQARRQVLEQDLLAASEDVSKAQAFLEKIPAAINEQQAYECWSCGKLGTIKDGKLIEASDPNLVKQSAAASRNAIAEQKQLIQQLQDKKEAAGLAVREVKVQLAKSQQAQQKLNEIGLEKPQATMSVDDARAGVELRRQRIQASKIKGECDELRDGLYGNIYMVAVLSPEGMRKEVLAKKLASFNELLQVICETAGWPEVKIDDTLSVRFNGRPYSLASNGQKFAINVALQVAITKMDGSKILVIDGMDVLDRELRNGLMTLLDSIPIPSIVTCTVDVQDNVPDLGEMGLAYWAETGTANPVKQAVAV